MGKNITTTKTEQPAALSTAALDLKIEDALQEIAGLRRRTLATAWQIGSLLRERKSRTAHGDWTDYLERIGIAESTARLYMRLSSEYTAEGLRRFPTIEAARAALAAPKTLETSVLTPALSEELRQSAARVLERERKVSLNLGRLLIKAKGQCTTEQWLPFLEACAISPSDADALIAYARQVAAGGSPDPVFCGMA